LLRRNERQQWEGFAENDSFNPGMKEWWMMRWNRREKNKKNGDTEKKKENENIRQRHCKRKRMKWHTFRRPGQGLPENDLRWCVRDS